MTDALRGRIAVVAGATRGAGRGIAIELAAAGATVYVTGRSTVDRPSDMRRPETIDETAEIINSSGGHAIPVRVDHTVPTEVRELFTRIRNEHQRLDVVVNDIWGGDPLTSWDTPFWEHSLNKGLLIQERGVHTHIITSYFAAPLLKESDRGLIVEITDAGGGTGYRDNLYYDLAKHSVIRLAEAQQHELRGYGVTAVALTPGFLRSESMLDGFGVTEENWRDAGAKDRHFLASESPRFIGRAVAAIAADNNVERYGGQLLTSWGVAKEYGFTDLDGSTPDWGSYFAQLVSST